MKGDFTRFSFDRTKRYSKVLKQQGRVDLDADWNESDAILDHLDRTTRVDVIGECGAPEHAGGFAIGLNAAGTDLTISKGRFYSHGILCELFQDTTYLKQPDLPGPPAPNPADGRVDVVYIDVWDRQITALEDPEIREVALGGPDTTTRVKTIAQVRILADQGAVTCGNAPLPTPSGGRLSTSLTPVPPTADPCLIAPAGGYAGLENRLYRVEIHDPGGLGKATFKWSRDNGSVVFAVNQFVDGQPAQIVASRLGRDQVLTLHPGDWVEVLGDDSELDGVPGSMARVVDLDEARRLITLSADVSAHALEPHPKVRRWDQPGDAIPVAAGPLPLEDGIQVSFSGADFRTGDYWTFTARTATAAISPLKDAAPQGIIHHYCPLALVTWQALGDNTFGATITDCRKPFPPLTELESGCCCCTITVGDGVTSHGDFGSIREAIASLRGKERVAEVCILPGRYQLDHTVVIETGRLTLKGCGIRSVILGPDQGPALLVSNAGLITLEDLVIETFGTDPALRIDEGERILVRECLLFGSPWAIIAQVFDSQFLNNTISGGLWISDGSSEVQILDNSINGGHGPGIGLGGQGTGQSLLDGSSGVVGVQILDNSINGAGGPGIATVLNGDSPPDGIGDVEDLLIARNTIDGNGQGVPALPYNDLATGGIVLSVVNGLRIIQNEITGNGGVVDNGILLNTRAAARRLATGDVGPPANPAASPADVINVFACGIFLSSVQDVEVAGNTVTGNGIDWTVDPFIDLSNTGTTYQGGIVILDALGGWDLGGDSPVATGTPAARVHENTVICPQGHSLILQGLGPMSVSGNSLSSLGVYPQPTRILNQIQTVFILNQGRAYPIVSLALTVGDMVRLDPGSAARLGSTAIGRQFGTSDGRVSFHGNQVTFRMQAPGAQEENFDPVLIATRDELSLQDNQLVADPNDGFINSHVTTFGFTVRTSGNRVSEVPFTATFSYSGSGTYLIISLNQFTHCESSSGSAQLIDLANQILIPSNCELADATVRQLRGEA